MKIKIKPNYDGFQSERTKEIYKELKQSNDRNLFDMAKYVADLETSIIEMATDHGEQKDIEPNLYATAYGCVMDSKARTIYIHDND